MGVNTKGYIFKKIGKKEFMDGIKDIPGMLIVNDFVKKDGSYISGTLVLKYKSIDISVFLFIDESSDEYVRIFKGWKGFETVKPNIPNYGKNQFVISLSGYQSDESIQIISLILKKFGGVLIPNDANEDKAMLYLKGELESKIIYPTLKDVPFIILNSFVRDYLINSDISKINNRLNSKIKGLDLLKEFAIRNLDR